MDRVAPLSNAEERALLFLQIRSVTRRWLDDELSAALAMDRIVQLCSMDPEEGK